MNRRDFVQMAGGFGLSLYGLNSLIGCGATVDGTFTDLSFPTQSTPPVLPGDSNLGWWMRGNYAAVDDEIEAFDLEVMGSLPPALNGMFLRNGPNPKGNSSSFWLMGAGMLHGVHLSNGKALSYRNRWIQTEALKRTETNVLSNLGNTALVNHGGRVLALYEAGTPHEVTAQKLETVGIYTFSEKLNGPMTAHPKIDPKTGEMCFIGYSPLPPYLRFHTVSAAGNLIRSEIIELPRGVMMHDFQLTENYAVFFDLPMTFDLMAAQTSPFPVKFDPALGARIGVMPRTGTNADVKWFDIEPCFMFHTMNAYETSDGTVLIEGCRMESIWEQGFSTVLPAAVPFEWQLNMSTGKATERAVFDTTLDFPMIDLRMQGQKHRISYGLHQVLPSEDYPLHPDGVVKYDRVTGEQDQWHCGYGVQPDEALFVADPADTGEDAGWLLTMVYNRADNVSELVVLDAQKLSDGPIARVKMPRRVPFGFHGIWVPDAA